MSDLWTPSSDDLLHEDPIAKQKVSTPFEPGDLEAHGIVLPDSTDDDADEAAASVELALLDDDDDSSDEPGDCDDDDEIEDPDDGPVSDDT